ncbi:hypothetical protein SORBI_3003G164000 [Sorghum bicolor]|uniref:Uncharacterized protein n=1 Tax=Sorghum bicolor TaxID=4558 RepID=A0A1B6Q3J8_SORBI|nr:hypothetical protein SORBI_3003G164000 [Sorghum bicolor]
MKQCWEARTPEGASWDVEWRLFHNSVAMWSGLMIHGRSVSRPHSRSCGVKSRQPEMSKFLPMMLSLKHTRMLRSRSRRRIS